MKKITASTLPTSHVRAPGNYVFTSGIYGIDRTNHSLPADFYSEAELAVKTMISLAKDHGMSRNNFVRCRVFLKDMLDVAVINHIFLKEFGTHLPAMTIMQLPHLAGPYHVQVEGFGLKDDSGISKEIIVNPHLYTPDSFPYPHGVKFGNFVFTSLHFPLHGDSSLPEEDFNEQIRLAIKNMISTLEIAGCSPKDIIKNVVLLRDITRFDDFNAVYTEFFRKGENPPARSCYGAEALYGISQMAIECVGYIGGQWETLQSAEAPVLPLPFCQGVKAENLIFVSGQIGNDPITKTTPETFIGQTQNMMKNMMNIAAAGGAKAEDFVKCSSFLTEIGQLDYYSTLYNDYFPEAFPAYSIFQVGGLAYTYVIEIDGIAYVEES